MSAPTARIDQATEPTHVQEDNRIEEDEDDVLIDATAGSLADKDSVEVNEKVPGGNEELVVDQDGRPRFPAAKDTGKKVKKEMRSIQIPPHRFNAFKTSWMKIYQPLVEHLKLQVMIKPARKRVLFRTCDQTTDPGAMQKAEDFLRAINMGFDIDDAIALLRLDDLYIETFEVKDVKSLTGDHLSRAIGRIAGKDGKTKFAIENASRTRVVLADSTIHILGGFSNIKIARETIVSLILGAPPGKVYGNLRIISSRMKERY
ncbi:hypothetical protein TRICI_001206 [Trichomonascus ciferrii]|uniref:Pre-rRNA-processing protein PNO1 n=1 Tax=Trichomonascus ciferrii TaxID=44093 RepID=A0A642V8X2_9ASCO|nr:hypothetical protein TRICI_001206 [Trichomonascus ciferrii]